MSDVKALEAQIDRLIAAGFSQVESNRLLGSSVEVISGKVGRLCDDLREYMAHTDDRIRESEGKIRVLESKYQDVDRRVKSIEEAERARRAAASR
jgi:hypothetical protein